MNDVCCLVLLRFDGAIQCNHINISRYLYCVSHNTIKFGLGWVKKYGPMSNSGLDTTLFRTSVLLQRPRLETWR